MVYQICLNNAKWLVDTFTNATFIVYNYLVQDHHPSTPENKTVVTNIFPEEQLTYYINRNTKVKQH